MIIVADKDIPLVEEYFSNMGDVILLEGRKITRADLEQADALLVRTITPVNQALLDHTPVRFVASATAGIDHIDQSFLQDRKIGFAYAPGCNARSVAEYVLSALCVLAEKNPFALEDMTVGIIGCGHVGSQVRRFLQALGVTCLLNDPPLQDAGEDQGFCKLDELIHADIITLHTPFIEEGPYRTHDLVDKPFLNSLKTDAILINTSRGQVVNEKDLLAHLSLHPEFNLVIDVWNNEPDINSELLIRADISTPHIAGYTLDAKYRATRMIYRAACEHLGQDYDGTRITKDFTETDTKLILSSQDTDMDLVQLAVLACYDVRSDSASLRRELDLDDAIRPQFFDELRKTSTMRREFPSMKIDIPSDHQSATDVLQSLGFKTQVHS